MAAAMVLFGDILDGEAAERHGLAWRCVPDEELLDAAVASAARAADAPPELSRRAKATLQRMSVVPAHDEAVNVEIEAQLWSMQQPFFAERMAAMRDRIKNR